MVQGALAQQEQMTAALNQTCTQIDHLTSKVNALAARPERQPAPPVEMPVAHTAAPTRRPTQNLQLKKMRSQLDQQGKASADTRDQLESTRGDLSDTRMELTGSIARTHDDLVLLQRKGERNDYEFNIAKSKQFQREGQLSIRLRKANAKHQYADLELIAEGRNVSQKHVNLYQPAMFYTPDSAQPVELVINSISQDNIHGYVSSPKFRQSELASIPNANASGASVNQSGTTNVGSQSAPRQTLPQPR